MTLRRRLHPLARRDLAEVMGFYRAEAGVGLARRFVNELDRVVKMLSAAPGLGTPVDDWRRAFPLRGFPYTLIYRPTDASIRILVIRHQSRDPEFGDQRR